MAKTTTKPGAMYIRSSAKVVDMDGTTFLLIINYFLEYKARFLTEQGRERFFMAWRK